MKEIEIFSLFDWDQFESSSILSSKNGDNKINGSRRTKKEKQNFNQRRFTILFLKKCIRSQFNSNWNDEIGSPF